MPTAKQRVESTEIRLFDRYDLDVRSTTVSVSRPALQLRVLDTGHGPPTVFLHGVGEVASQWAPLWAELRDRRCIGVDLPGFGLSDEVDYHRVDLRRFAVRSLTDALDELELERAILVGNSLGGAFALWTAIDAPQRVAATALLGAPDPAVPGSRVSLPLAMVGVHGLNRLLLNLPVPPLAVNRAMYRLTLGNKAIERSPPEIVEVAHHAMDRPTFAPSMSTYMERVFRFRRPKSEFTLSRSELGQVQAPTLLIWGDHDRFGPVRAGRRLADALPDAQLVEIRGGHNPWLDRPSACAQELLAFLEPRGL